MQLEEIGSISNPVNNERGVKSKTMAIITACAIFVALSAYSISANAQTLFGSIVGAVIDSSGAAVVGATVTIVSAQTNDTRSAVTNDRGEYTLSTLTVGTYKVTITKPGFQGFFAERGRGHGQ